MPTQPAVSGAWHKTTYIGSSDTDTDSIMSAKEPSILRVVGGGGKWGFREKI